MCLFLRFLITAIVMLDHVLHVRRQGPVLPTERHVITQPLIFTPTHQFVAGLLELVNEVTTVVHVIVNSLKGVTLDQFVFNVPEMCQFDLSLFFEFVVVVHEFQWVSALSC